MKDILNLDEVTETWFDEQGFSKHREYQPGSASRTDERARTWALSEFLSTSHDHRKPLSLDGWDKVLTFGIGNNSLTGKVMARIMSARFIYKGELWAFSEMSPYVAEEYHRYEETPSTWPGIELRFKRPNKG